MALQGILDTARSDWVHDTAHTLAVAETVQWQCLEGNVACQSWLATVKHACLLATK